MPSRPDAKRTLRGLAYSAAFAAASLGFAAAPAQAQPGFVPEYHWCPGDYFHPEWGNNWEPNTCHDDFHRDNDGPNHDRDWHGYDDRRDYDRHDGQPGNYDGPPGNYYVPPGYTGPPPPPGGWQPAPFCIPFVNCAPV